MGRWGDNDLRVSSPIGVALWVYVRLLCEDVGRDVTGGVRSTDGARVCHL